MLHLPYGAGFQVSWLVILLRSAFADSAANPSCLPIECKARLLPLDLDPPFCRFLVEVWGFSREIVAAAFYRPLPFLP